MDRMPSVLARNAMSPQHVIVEEVLPGSAMLHLLAQSRRHVLVAE